ncbi:2Fe-2S iron-sulfur cluster-binding protein [Natronobeatus ordinarius]|uniref:2Fe-2S iron-sulfur cluster-binding protein n=1 Tax=Natronobeatus ordinarius TaxID=2963433 RepID=UPI0020CC38E4|nr:2Fe-2S iron-sulfur cluster-binding protein [Natronobeatus ordinarius]
MGDHSTSEPDQSADRSRVAVAVPRDLPDLERRRLLAAIGGTGAVVLAGCADEGPADDVDDALEDPDDDPDDVATYELVFLEDEETPVEVAEDEEILYPALDADVDVPYACEVGTCGDCTARYDGDATEVVTHDGNEYLDDDQLTEGWLLTCVAYPEADFELEVAHPDDE